MSNFKLFLIILITGLVLTLFYTLSIQSYSGTIMVVFGLGFLTLFFMIETVIPLELRNNKIFGIGFIITLILYSWMMLKINDMIIDYAFKNKAQQQFCGIIQREYSKSMGRGSIYFWHVENPENKQTFDFRKYNNDNLKIGQQICVHYAIDKRWQNTPYIYSIDEDFQN